MKKPIQILALIVALIGSGWGMSHAQQIQVDDGVLTLGLDPVALSVAGLSVAGVSSEVTDPGAFGPDSYDFNLISSTAATRPTTFAYELSTFAPFSGTGEAIGTLFFTSTTQGPLQFGDFTIAYDMVREVGTNSGFYLQSNIGTPIIAFDLSNFASVNADTELLTASAPAVVSPELATALGNPLFAGITAGQVAFNFNAVPVPEPSGLGLLALIGGIATLRRRLH